MSDRVSRTSHHLAVGTLDLADLRERIRSGWQAFYAAYPDQGCELMPWEQELIGPFVRPGISALVIGCGSGRDLIALAALGCRVTGVDPVDGALAAAARALSARRLTATLVAGFFDETDLAGPFDLVIFSYFTFSSIPESRRRTAALKKGAALLTAEGVMLVSYPRLGPAGRVPTRLARLVARMCRTDWRLEPGDLVWRDRSAARSYSYAHAFGPGELERETAAAGLRVVSRTEWLEGTAVVVEHA